MLILIPAAGASSRMRGRDKLLELIDYQPLLARQVSIALRAEANVVVALPPDRPDRTAIVEGMVADRLDMLMVDDADEGMSASIRAAVCFATKRGAKGMMILPADMPEIEVDDLIRMTHAFDGSNVVRATDMNGQAGHPVIFPARLFRALSGLGGDQGARVVMVGEKVDTVPLPGLRATTDLDTPEDWDAWRLRTGRQRPSWKRNNPGL
ncbi:nucleotidyltransferase family protein [uncultured Roseovarius sp.]|uniref:nucleotidyltransferase family protein n=1 Tax=uncultured Roseovarius sp. TaxID=293344 RepID=UPI00260EBE28|nr:nucleotidyltransferase family protein [uncultured Roseovarius sp.]